MRIGILEAGLLREQLATRFDPYPRMFADLLAVGGNGFEYHQVSVVRGEVPESIHECDGWLITGSRHGVYDRLEWMAPLEDFIRKLADTRIPLIGVCFGHQIIASALGGEVVKSDKGWGVGLHRYRVERRHAWMSAGESEAAIYAYHQDQVVRCPAAAEVFLSSDFCPYAGLSYGDSIISVQAHPEFEADYETALIETFGGNLVPADIADAALASMREGRPDREMLARWFTRFYISHQESSAMAGNA